MKFSDIPAHEAVKNRLRAMADSGRLPHALLLEGPSGIGKFALARAFAQYIHCENRVDGEPCGVCPSCRQHETFNHIDTYFSYPVLGGSNTVSDDYAKEWRHYLSGRVFMNFEAWQREFDNPNGQPVIYSSESASIIRKFSTTSYSTRFKILLMWLPERMQEECANKMLKMIEEPLEDSLLIFVSDTPAEILPTIYSRLQRIEVKRLPDSVVAGYVSQTHGMNATDAQAIAHLSEGSITDAEKQLSANDENVQFLGLFMQLMRLAYQRKVGALRKWSVDVAALGREAAIRFLRYCERMMRENFINNLHMPQIVYLNSAERDFCARFSPFINERNVESLLRELGSARVDVAANGNAKMVFFDLAVKVILLLKR